MSDFDLDHWLAECRSGVATRQLLAIHELVEHGARGAAGAMVALLRSPTPAVRAAAAAALVTVGADEPALVGAALIGVLGDPDPIVRSDAVDALGALRYAPAATGVRALLANDPEPLVRASAAETLGDLGDARALPDLLHALGDPDDAVRGFAANAIGLVGTSEQLDDLAARAAVDAAPQVRAELHGARYRLGEAGDLDRLLVLLDENEEELGPNILSVLDDLSTRVVPPALHGDAPRLRARLAALAARCPLLAGDVHKVIANLALLDAAR